MKIRVRISNSWSKNKESEPVMPDHFGDTPKQPLRYRWEMRRIETGEECSVDHNTGTTTCDDPRLQPNSDQRSNAANSCVNVEAQAATWPHLRLAAKIPHENGEDDEQTETRPGKRVRQNNQPEPRNVNQMSLPYAQTPGASGGNTINPQVDNSYAATNIQNISRLQRKLLQPTG